MKTLLKATFNKLPLSVASSLYSTLKGVPLDKKHPHFERFLKASMVLGDRLAKLNVDELEISPYSKEYLKDIQVNASACLTKFVGVLSFALPHKINQQTHFLDYGAGTGLISLMAAELGIQVTYNDLFETSCKDFVQIAKKLSPGHKIHVVYGDTQAVVSDAERRQILFDGVGSYDVIEHIYKPQNFYAEIQKVVKPGAVVYMATSANSFNSKTVSDLALVQSDIEGCSKSPRRQTGEDTYFEIRRRHSATLAKTRDLNLSETEIENLASRTRGLTLRDMEEQFDQLIRDPSLSSVDPCFPTNTCHPESGNWAEHLLNYPIFLNSLNSHWNKKVVIPEQDSNRSRYHVIGVLTQRV